MHLHWTNIFSAFSLNKMWRGIYFWSIYIGVHHMHILFENKEGDK
jgi:hypothetical protein